MKLLSLNVARPRLIVYQGTTINTGIFKEPVAGPVQLRTLNLDGDRQADLTVHGGPNKAVYGYPSEHYPFWREELPAVNLRGECLAKTSPPPVSRKTNFTSGISFRSVHRS